MRGMKKILTLLILMTSVGVALAQGTDCTSGGTVIKVGVTGNTYTDTTVVSGNTYGYLITANTNFGFSCSTIVNAVIPATGTHSVTLGWTLSTTPGATYSVFRAQAPAPPGSPTATVN